MSPCPECGSPSIQIVRQDLRHCECMRCGHRGPRRPQTPGRCAYGTWRQQLKSFDERGWLYIVIGMLALFALVVGAALVVIHALPPGWLLQ
jgi:Zn ribbon nucleic-acid-binding protein